MASGAWGANAPIAETTHDRSRLNPSVPFLNLTPHAAGAVMPELPDIENYLSALQLRVLRQPIEGFTLNNPFLLRTVAPPMNSIVGREVHSLRRIGKRIVLELSDDTFLVLHLMIAGRLHWRPTPAKPPGKTALLVLWFPEGILYLTEAGKKKRASLHLLPGGRGSLWDSSASVPMFEVVQYSPHARRILDAGDDLNGAATLVTRFDIDLKHALSGMNPDPQVPWVAGE